MKRLSLLVLGLLCLTGANAYTNPILPYDYSDPDVCRVGNDYYMTSSSFNCIPGLQILHSNDLIHWTIVDTALPDYVPGTENEPTPQYGGGVWAPSIRYHENRFYIYYGDPDRGIYCVRSEETQSLPCLWEKAVLVKKGKGLIDPCPLWTEDGKCYMVHAFAGSRAGFKSALAVCELTPDGLSTRTESHIVFDGHPDNPTCEGPKFYFRNGYYYIFCPAGGVSTGWQLAMRSHDPYGPYESKRVLQQGATDINAPHQGAWVTSEPIATEAGDVSDWFFHFQDVGVAGRIVHLQPMRWVDDWPIMGKDGEPVQQYRLGKTERLTSHTAGIQSVWRDEFDATSLSLSWQWSGNRASQFAFCNAQQSMLRLFSYPADSLPFAPNLLLQKIPAGRRFVVTAKVRFTPHPKTAQYEQAGLIVAGRRCYTLEAPGNGEWVWLRVEVSDRQECRFYLSHDGKTFAAVGDKFQAVEGEWIGAKIGLYCTRKPIKINDSGYMDVDYFEIR